jgi:hypothetical protein
MAKLWKYVLQLPTLARVMDWAGLAVNPVPTAMLPWVTASVTNSSVVGAVVPEGFVGRGEGAPAGTVRLVVTLMDGLPVNVVPFWNVMLELHEASAGKFTAVPTAKVLAVPVPFAVTVPHGNVSAGLLEVVGAAVGVLVADAATTVGALVLEQPETIAAETMKASVAPTKSGRLSDVFMKLGASKLPQKGATPPAKRRLSYDGVHFFRRARIPGKKFTETTFVGRSPQSGRRCGSQSSARRLPLCARAASTARPRRRSSPDRRSARRDAFDGW